MADLGSLYVNILPKYGNEFKAFATTLARGGITSGQQFTQGFNSSMGKGFSSLSGIAIGAWSAIANKGMQLISSTVDKAINRVDTFYQFPKVMSAFGISAEDADKSIKKLNESVLGLPTALDEVTEITRALVPLFQNNIEKATEATMALNDAFVFSGSNGSLDEISFVMQRMITLQKVSLKEWKPLTKSMGAALTVLAQDLYGAGASSTDLYKALQTGKLSVSEFIDELVRMDQVGGKSIGAFKDTARTMTSGIKTSLANMRNAVARGIQAIFDTIGLENIKTFTSNIGTSIENFLKQIGNLAKFLAPVFDFVAKNADKLVWVIVTGFGIKGVKAIKSFTAGIIADIGGMFSFLKRLDFIQRFENIFGGGKNMSEAVNKWTKKLQPVKIEFTKLAKGLVQTGALAGIAIAEIGLLVVEIGAIVTGIGALSRIPGVKDLLNEGIETLQTLFKGLGSILGEFIAIAGVVAGFTALTVIFNPATVLIGIGAFAGAFAGITASIGLVVAGFGAISRIPYVKEFIADGGELISSIFSVFGKIWGSIAGAVAEAVSYGATSGQINALKDNATAFNEAIDKIQPSLAKLGELKPVQADNFNLFAEALKSFAISLQTIAGIGITDDIKERVKTLKDQLTSEEGLLPSIKAINDTIIKAGLDFATMENLAKVINQINIITSSLQGVYRNIQDINVMAGITNAEDLSIKTFFSSIGDGIRSIKESATDFPTAIMETITSNISRITEAVSSLGNTMSHLGFWNEGVFAGNEFMRGIRDAVYNSEGVLNAINNLKNLMAHAGFWEMGVFAGNEFMRGLHDALVNTITIDADIDRIKGKTKSVEELTGANNNNSVANNQVYHISYNDYGIHTTGEDRLAQIVERVRG